MKVLDTAALLTADRSQGIPGGGAGHRQATFVVDVTAITRTTGTLDVSLQVRTADGTLKNVATVTGLTAISLNTMTIDAFWTPVPGAIPEPDLAVWDLVGDTTSVSGTIEVVYSD